MKYDKDINYQGHSLLVQERALLGAFSIMSGGDGFANSEDRIALSGSQDGSTRHFE